MPGHLPPQLSLRLSDTGSKHGEPLRSPTKGEGCNILLFSILTTPCSTHPKHQNYSYKTSFSLSK